jgi:hypothetical protein
MGRKVEYTQSIISYLDVLGFRDLIDNKSAGHISRIVRILKEKAKPDQEISKGNGVKFFNFSDTVIRITPIKSQVNQKDKAGNLFWEILDLVHIQYHLICQEIILRGAVSAGDIVKSWGVMYGPGLVNAYELEQRASFPRIIVDPKVFQLLRETSSLWLHDFEEERKAIMNLLKKDTDGHWFVDYLRSIETEMDYPEEDYPKFIRKHADLIADGLVRQRLNSRVVKKFKWLKQYHNSTVIERFDKVSRKGLLV